MNDTGSNSANSRRTIRGLVIETHNGRPKRNSFVFPRRAMNLLGIIAFVAVVLGVALTLISLIVAQRNNQLSSPSSQFDDSSMVSTNSSMSTTVTTTATTTTLSPSVAESPKTPPPSNSPTCEHKYISSSSQYSRSGSLEISIPPRAKEGDLLVLFLSRTDDVLPMELDGWTMGPSCLKSHNGQRECWTMQDCLVQTREASTLTKYCREFPRDHDGRDLATAVFYRFMETNLNASLPTSQQNQQQQQLNDDDFVVSLNLPGSDPSWAILTAIPMVDTRNPIRSAAGASCDKSRNSVFPSVRGQRGDVLLLHMAFDDAADPNDFVTPPGTTRIDHVHGADEAGFLFGRRLDQKGKTRNYETLGEGGPNCKDVLLSVVVRQRKVMLDDDDNADGNNNIFDNDRPLLPLVGDDCDGI